MHTFQPVPAGAGHGLEILQEFQHRDSITGVPRMILDTDAWVQDEETSIQIYPQEGHIIRIRFMTDLVPGIIYSFATLFIILDPLLSVPIFSAMTKGQSPAEIHKQAFIAVAVAGSLMYIFLIFNKVIFDILGLSIPSFQIAGGVLLFLLGIQEALGIEIGHSKGSVKSAAGVVIGTPLLCGPGTITTVMLLSKDYGFFIPFVAITLSLLATWLVLFYSDLIQRILGEVVTDIMGKVLGMLLAAIAVNLIVSGMLTLVRVAA